MAVTNTELRNILQDLDGRLGRRFEEAKEERQDIREQVVALNGTVRQNQLHLVRHDGQIEGLQEGTKRHDTEIEALKAPKPDNPGTDCKAESNGVTKWKWYIVAVIVLAVIALLGTAIGQYHGLAEQVKELVKVLPVP